MIEFAVLGILSVALVGMGTARRRQHAVPPISPEEMAERIAMVAASVELRPHQREPARAPGAAFAQWLPPLALAATVLLMAYNTWAGLKETPAATFKPWCLGHQTLVGAYGDMGSFNLSVSGASNTAQELFRQGLLHAWGFNQHEAQRNFRAAIEDSPECSMCHWGLAYAMGPIINKVAGEVNDLYPVFSSDDCRAARTAALRAAELAAPPAEGPAPPAWEGEYARALLQRYPEEDQWSPQDHGVYEYKYSEAMAAIAAARPDDVTARALQAEALLTSIPWDYYDPKAAGTFQGYLGPERPVARAARAVLETTLESRHPLGLHLYIHLTESLRPGRGEGSAEAGEAAADALLALVPGQGHLVHMPSHTYFRIGRYSDAVDANMKAREANLRAATACLEPYVAEHNLNLLVHAAAMGGESGVALQYGQKIREMPLLTPTTFTFKCEWTGLVLNQVKFSKWRALWDAPPPPTDARGHPVAVFAWHYGRAFALAGLRQDQAKVRKAARAAERAAGRVPEDPQTRPGGGKGLWSSEGRRMTDLGVRMLRARMAIVGRNLTGAESELREAVRIEDLGAYIEPPRLFHQPARQCLGTVLLAAKRPAEAEAVFREDLEEYPANGWSLLGLRQSMERQAERYSEADVAAAEAERVSAWARADVQIGNPCPSLGIDLESLGRFKQGK
mmetsp:Transcript_40784/g.130152  ORF Transcript_40784/g.130152 Transcript_40784/m.130152 type:complete len:678 (+) Transcript_40784:181-2214(+)|eukprot:CAMPEP_0182882652 /NCGR_PEP_ID=MMETSP0034_2-20130328/17912_1 /TAXON_ID=156128 /ORGANISM="Nephroselmis pyriformis, Strain CCMP717" /LENGTH=677 /DNA_ID=CAMNT_0025015759 /DNA_START=100 /DNA_END=2133 /DNA_ORIENTATION=-